MSYKAFGENRTLTKVSKFTVIRHYIKMRNLETQTHSKHILKSKLSSILYK